VNVIFAQSRSAVGQQPPPTPEDMAELDLEALGGVRKYPVRVKCALLAWNALESAMAERSSQGTAR